MEIMFHAILIHYGLGGRELVEKNGAQVTVFGETLLTKHLCVGNSLTQHKKKELKGQSRCFLGAAIRVINSQIYAAVKDRYNDCSGGFSHADEALDLGTNRAFLVDCPGCLEKVQWHGSCGACLTSVSDKDGDCNFKIHLSHHGRPKVMDSHNYKRHKAA